MIEVFPHGIEGPEGPVLIGQSPVFLSVVRLADLLAPTSRHVLLEGESGAGHGTFAWYIHRHSGMSDRPLRVVYCQHFAGDVERELRALRRESGMFYLCSIDNLNATAQSLVMELLEDDPAGARIRIVANCYGEGCISHAIRTGTFREDLVRRLDFATISLPPLRVRIGDVRLLVEHFIRFHGQGVAYWASPETWRKIEESRWSGNVRALECCVIGAMMFAGSDHELCADRFWGP